MKHFFMITILIVNLYSNSFDKSKDTTVKTNSSLASSQKKIDKTYSETETLLYEYKDTLKENQSQKIYNKDLREFIKSQQKEIESLNTQIAGIEVTAREVMPLIKNMVVFLDKFIQLDVPFLLDERQKRVERLERNVNRSDLSVSEKYRQVLEAYKIENDYGRTIESFQGEIDGKVVEFLRIGRVSLMYRTMDKNQYGYYNKETKSFQISDESDLSKSIDKGIKIAKKRTSPDLILIKAGGAK
ncbi:MAG: DUF3450 domain-containing protein [Campylobacterales bacterium]|nr:DUF3450 domain-containing protein [Campylobacterales bacterium]